MFHAGLLVAPGRQAELGGERVVAGQGRVTRVQGAVPAAEEVDRHGAGVVPPQLTRHTAEEGERLDQAVQDGLRPLGRHGDGERAVGVRPGDQQDGDLAAAVGEVGVDVAEVGLGPTARRVVQRDERLAPVEPPGLQVAADLVVAALVAVLVAEAAEELRGGVPLLGRGLHVGVEDGVNDLAERPEGGGRPRPGLGVGRGFGVVQGFADGVPPDAELPGDLPNAEAVAVRLPDGREVVHRTHPSSLRPAELNLPPAARVVLRWSWIRCRGWSRIRCRSPAAGCRGRGGRCTPRRSAASAAGSPPSRPPPRSTGSTGSAPAVRTAAARSTPGGPARSAAAAAQAIAPTFFLSHSSSILSRPICSNSSAFSASASAAPALAPLPKT